jgi:zinc protease
MAHRYISNRYLSLRHRNGEGTHTLITPRLKIVLDSALLFMIVAASLSAPVAGTSLTARVIEGGPRIIMEPHPESDIVCLAVSVPTGSAFETPDTRGMSHFLEHMVFDGTERWSRIEMSDWVDERGAFLNAFTRKETAVYFLVVSRDDLEQGMELLSQMLLHSIFPPDEFEKERKIILEELRKGMDDPPSKRERLVDRYLYRGSDLAEPIMGYFATIETMRREDVMSFYRERYRTGLMRIHISGGFDPEQAGRWVRDYFPPETPPENSRCARLVHADGEPDLDPRWSGEITVRDAGDLEPGFDIIIPLPAPGAKDFPAALLTVNILQGEGSPLPALFASLSLPEPETGFEVHTRFSALRIHLPWSDGGEDSYGGVPDALATLAGWEPSNDEIESARTAHLSAELFDREKYHFYIMLHGEKIALFGETYLEAALEGIRNVNGNDCRRFIRSTFGNLNYNAFLLRPGISASLPAMRGEGETRTLDNGCVVTSRRRSNSGVAALHLLVRGRNCLDGEAGLEGMSALLHKLFESSTAGKELSRELEALGCRLQWQDNPFIPMDDYYLNPAYSFVRLEAPAGRIEPAARLLIDFLVGTGITGDDLTGVMGSFGMELRVRGGSATGALRETVYRELLGDHPYGSPLFPKPENLRGVTIDQISTFRERYMRGGNLIASLVSPMPEGEALDLLTRLLSEFPVGESASCPPLPDSGSYRVVTDTIQKEGAYLAAGWLFQEGNPDRLAAILVAAQILSRRMQLELREKQGLTYSTGCGVTLLPGGAVAMATIGTRAQNLDIAESGLKAEIASLISEPPSPVETETAKSRLLGRRARSELSSINEASAAGRDLFMTNAAFPMNERISRVSAEDIVSAVAGFAIERALLVRLVPGERGREESAPPAMRMPMR